MSTDRKAAEIITADVVLFSKDGQVLLVQRDWPPFEGCWALPGGHLDPGEEPVEAAARELAEETGVQLTREDLREVGRYGAPGRDPRGPYVTWVFTAIVPEPVTPAAGDDARDARWWPRRAVTGRLELAFDHGRIIDDLVEAAP
jgi:8-oxo-dGTP diphosphatase